MNVIVAVGTGTPSPPPCGVFSPIHQTAPSTNKSRINMARALYTTREKGKFRERLRDKER